MAEYDAERIGRIRRHIVCYPLTLGSAEDRDWLCDLAEAQHQRIERLREVVRKWQARNTTCAWCGEKIGEDVPFDEAVEMAKVHVRSCAKSPYPRLQAELAAWQDACRALLLEYAALDEEFQRELAPSLFVNWEDMCQ